MEINANCLLQAHIYFKNSPLQRCYLTQILKKKLVFLKNRGYTSKPFFLFFKNHDLGFKTNFYAT